MHNYYFSPFLGSLTEAYDELGNNYKVPLYCINKPANLVRNENVSNNDNEDEEKDIPTGEAFPVKFRLSTGKELKLQVYPSDTIFKLKKILYKREGVTVVRQRWFYSGRLLTDKMTVQDVKIVKGYVVQIIVSEENGWDAINCSLIYENTYERSPYPVLRIFLSS